MHTALVLGGGGEGAAGMMKSRLESEAPRSCKSEELLERHQDSDEDSVQIIAAPKKRPQPVRTTGTSQEKRQVPRAAQGQSDLARGAAEELPPWRQTHQDGKRPAIVLKPRVGSQPKQRKLFHGVRASCSKDTDTGALPGSNESNLPNAHRATSPVKLRPAKKPGKQPAVMQVAPAKVAELQSLARTMSAPVPTDVEEISNLRYAHDNIRPRFSHGSHAQQDVLSSFLTPAGVQSAAPKFWTDGFGTRRVLLTGVPALVVVQHRGVQTVINGNRRLRAAFEYKESREPGLKVHVRTEKWNFDDGQKIPPNVFAKYMLATTSLTGGVDVALR